MLARAAVPYHKVTTPRYGDTFMVPQTSLLVALLLLIDRIPLPDQPVRRGRPKTHTDRLFLKALVIMIVRRLLKVHSLLAVLAEPTAEMQRLRALLTEHGRYPTRRTFEQRLKAIRTPCPPRSRVWCSSWSRCSVCGRMQVRWRSTGPSCVRTAGSGIRKIASRGRSLTPPSTPKPTGPNPAGGDFSIVAALTGLPRVLL